MKSIKPFQTFLQGGIKMNYRLIENKGDYYLVSDEKMFAGDLSISHETGFFQIEEVVSDPIDGYEYGWDGVSSRYNINTYITELGANGGNNEKLISSTKPFKNMHLFDFDNDLIKVGNSYFIVSDKEPRDRSLCITFNRINGEPSVDTYYQEDASYYTHKPKSIVCSTHNIPNNNLILDEASLLSVLRDRKINKILK